MSAAALQKAIVTTLRGALAIPVYDEVPDKAALPYVVIDSVLSANADAVADLHDRVTVYLSVWAEGVNALGVLGYMGQIKAALHNTKPAMDAGTCAILRERRQSTDRDIDRRVRIGRLTYEAQISS